MTCSKNFGRLLQVGCLGLIGTLAAAGCGGSESPSTKTDGAVGLDGGGGTAGTAALKVDKPVVDIGSVDLGQSGTATVVVTNIGTAPSGTLSIAAGAGVTTTGCTGTLAVSANCSLIITATPTAIGSFNSSVSISANPGAVTPLQISVTGSAVQGGVFTVTPASISLGNVLVGAAVAKQTLSITAGVALTDLAIGLNGADITKDATSTCTANLGTTTPCTVVIDLAYTSGGAKTDSVVISAGGANGVTKTVVITAVAQNPAKLVVSPSTPQSLATSVGSPSSPVVFGVSNSGDLATGALKVSFTGANAADFSATSSAGCTLIAPLGTSCSISVVFSPATASTTAETATFVVTDTGTGASTVSVPLSGTAYGPSVLAITPAASDLGTVLVGATGVVTTFTVTNSGATASGALTVNITGDPAEVLKATDTCTGASLAAAGTCTVGLQLKPTTVGAKSAILTVGATGGNPAVKTVTGTAISSATLTASPVALDFGTVRVNNVGTAQTVTVTNKGGIATGVLTFTKTGDFGMFPIAANTCSAALAPASTCTFTVNYAPTVGAVSNAATYTVTDGVAGATVSLSGVAGSPSTISIDPTVVKSCVRPANGPGAAAATICFNDTVIGGASSAQATFTVTADTTLPAGTSDTGAIAAKLIGANAADFAVVTNGCKTALLAGSSCQITVSFSPAAVGLSQAGLSVTTANGGSATSSFQVNGLAVIQIVAGNLVDTPPTAVVTAPKAADLDFGQVPNLTDGTRPNKFFTIIVRGPTAAATPFPTTTITATLTNPGTPSDFDYVPGGQTTNNPCMGAILTPSTPGTVGNWQPLASEYGIMCIFEVEFFPQTGKGAKTATISATGTGGGSDTQTLTGTATGPLTLSPSTTAFADTSVGTSTNDPEVDADLTFTLTNNGQSTQGPFTTLLGGTDAGQFHIVSETCSTSNSGSATTIGTLTQGQACQVGVAFTPTTIGAKNGSLTVTAASGETATATFTGNGTTGVSISVTPVTQDFGTIIETQASTWQTITVSNPAGAPTTGQITYSIVSTAGTSHVAAFTTATANSPAIGTCGLSGTVSLAATKSCTILVQFNPASTDAPGAIIGTGDKTVLRVDSGSTTGSQDVPLTGTVASMLTVSPATLNFGNVVVNGVSAAQSLRVNNLGAAAATLSFANVGAFSSVTGTTCVTTAGGLAAGASCVVALQMGGSTTVGTAVSQAYNVTYSGAIATATLTGTTVSAANLVAVGVNQTTPGTIDLGGVRVGSTSGSVVLTFQNTGGQATTPVQFMWDTTAPGTADPEFLLGGETGTCIGSLVQPAKTCTVTINFKPGATLGLRGPKLLTLSAAAGGSVALFNLQGTSLSATASAWTTTAVGTINGFSALTGTTPTGGTTTQELLFTNGSGANLTDSAVAIAGGNTFNSEFTVDLSDGGAATKCADTSAATTITLANGQSCTMLVSFKPVAVYSTTNFYRWASVTIAGATQTVFGTVQSPASLTAAPAPVSPATSVSLGEVALNSTKALAFVVTNGGQTATQTLAVTSSDPAYTVDTGCNVALAAGQTCTVNVTVHSGGTLGPIPAGGPATISLDDTGATPTAGTTTATFDVTATGVINAALSLPVGPVTFGTVIVGNSTTTAPTAITVTNVAHGQTTGPLAVTLDDAVNFTITNNYCKDVNGVALTLDGNGNSVAAIPATSTTPSAPQRTSSTCEVWVAYKPQTVPATGGATAHLSVAGTPGGTATVTLTGTPQSALTFALAGSPQTPAVTGTSFTVNMADTTAGKATALLLPASLSGTGAALFEVVNDGCYGASLPADGTGTCTVTVQYIGGTATGTAMLTVSDGSTGNGNTATLTLSH